MKKKKEICTQKISSEYYEKAVSAIKYILNEYNNGGNSRVFIENWLKKNTEYVNENELKAGDFIIPSYFKNNIYSISFLNSFEDKIQPRILNNGSESKTQKMTVRYFEFCNVDIDFSITIDNINSLYISKSDYMRCDHVKINPDFINIKEIYEKWSKEMEDKKIKDEYEHQLYLSEKADITNGTLEDIYKKIEDLESKISSLEGSIEYLRCNTIFKRDPMEE